jgi:Arc/MetJ family transcription regulator
MKRTNLVLDEALLEEALRVSGERTYSRTVETALSELVRRARAGKILELVGSGAWEGDLGVTRGDTLVRERAGIYRTRARARRRAAR